MGKLILKFYFRQLIINANLLAFKLNILYVNDILVNLIQLTFITFFDCNLCQLYKQAS